MEASPSLVELFGEITGQHSADLAQASYLLPVITDALKQAHPWHTNTVAWVFAGIALLMYLQGRSDRNFAASAASIFWFLIAVGFWSVDGIYKRRTAVEIVNIVATGYYQIIDLDHGRMRIELKPPRGGKSSTDSSISSTAVELDPKQGMYVTMALDKMDITPKDPNETLIKKAPPKKRQSNDDHDSQDTYFFHYP